ncbi:hypothetical protein B0H10DRAFT_1946967 [Mycena sp. CBHHK59/15]|nr:hypothetical protein B0H10DRAFT_1946967 [Mycena sp. CBHHK59/15]
MSSSPHVLAKVVNVAPCLPSSPCPPHPPPHPHHQMLRVVLELECRQDVTISNWKHVHAMGRFVFALWGPLCWCLESHAAYWVLRPANGRQQCTPGQAMLVRAHAKVAVENAVSMERYIMVSILKSVLCSRTMARSMPAYSVSAQDTCAWHLRPGFG